MSIIPITNLSMVFLVFKINYNIFNVITLIFICLFFLNGCVVYSNKSDVSKKSDQWGGYEYNQEYTLLADVFLLKAYSGSKNERMALAPERNFPRRGIHSTPNSTREYNLNKGNVKYGNDVIGVIHAGTIIKTISLENISGFTVWYGLTKKNTVYGQVKNGKYQDTIVDMSDISIFYKDLDGNDSDVYKYKPDPRLLNWKT